jgi:hypothetical protein
MALQGTNPESYLTESTLVYEGKHTPVMDAATEKHTHSLLLLHSLHRS